MPMPQLPLELIQLIVADPALRKIDLQSLSLTARAFPPLVRPHLFKRVEIPLSRISEGNHTRALDDPVRAITLDEMDRLMSLRRRPDLAGLVQEVCIHTGPTLRPPPESIRITTHDLMQLVYAVFPCPEEVNSSAWAGLLEAPPCLPLPCCQTLHTLQGLRLDLHTWRTLQTCTALCKLDITEISFREGVPAIPPTLPFRLETLELGGLSRYDTVSDFLGPFLRACASTLKHLQLGLNYNKVPGLSCLPRLVSLSVEMSSDVIVGGRWGEGLGQWFTTALPTCSTLERLRMTTMPWDQSFEKTPLGILASPEVAAALPATLKRIDFDTLPYKGELEAAMSNNKSVKVIGMPAQQHGDHSWADFCRRRGIKVVDSEMNEWPA